MRLRALLAASPLLTIATGCPTSHDLDPEPSPGMDGGLDAGLDAAAKDAGLDAHLSDASQLVDAGCGEPPRFQTCTSSDDRVGVVCGTEVCTGAAPGCCHQADGGTVCAAPGDDACRGPAPWIPDYTDYCDDRYDCAADELCVDTLSKAVGSLYVGGSCLAKGQTFCRGMLRHYTVVRCQRDCECLEGQKCGTGNGRGICYTPD